MARRTTTRQHPAPEERTAARRYLQHDYASERLHGEPGREANRNAQAIDEEHPRARDIALTGTPAELGELPAELRRHQRQARERAGISTADAARIRREYRSGPYQEPGDEQEPRRPGAREIANESGRELAGIGSEARRRAGGAVSAGLDELPSSWGQLVSYTILGGIGLSLLYLLLTNSRGPSEVILGITSTVASLISPTIDPLSPRASASASLRGTGTSRPLLPRSSPLSQGISLTHQATTTAKGLIP